MLESFQNSTTFELIPVKLPGLPKTGGGALAYLKFLFFTISELIALIYHAIFSGISGVFIALCQTRSTLLREEFLIRLVRLLARRPNLSIGFGLNGSNFTRWKNEDPVANRFRRVLGFGKFVGVLGPSQKNIIDKNFKTNDLRAIITPNTCEFEPLDTDEIRRKHADSSPLNVLHLSSLMEPKGFIEIIESMPDWPAGTQMVVCGKITSTIYDQRFNSVKESSDWLRCKTSTFENLTWIDGAWGSEKFKLFAKSHVFVLPTDYPVEAQPLVLLEAMACGCVIVTTEVGEIGYMVDDSNAIILKDKSARQISDAINRLAAKPELRLRLALQAREQFLARFSMEQNQKTWNEHFTKTFE